MVGKASLRALAGPALHSAFALAIWAKADALRVTDLGLRERQRVLESISYDIRKYSDLAIPQVSLAAQVEAGRLGVNLRDMRWQDQPRFDPGRQTFQWEHVETIGAIRNKCLAASSAQEIEKHLDDIRVAWILKSEDRRLTEGGYRTTRVDPDEAYREAGITLV